MDSMPNPPEPEHRPDHVTHRRMDSSPLLLTEKELIELLRIPVVSKTTDHHHVVLNLMRMHGLPCIHISKQPLYPFDAVRRWIIEKARKESMG